MAGARASIERSNNLRTFSHVAALCGSLGSGHDAQAEVAGAPAARAALLKARRDLPPEPVLCFGLQLLGVTPLLVRGVQRASLGLTAVPLLAAGIQERLDAFALAVAVARELDALRGAQPLLQPIEMAAHQ